jgi:ATP-dependent exoDNAse (exonuclease V) alpha subunit
MNASSNKLFALDFKPDLSNSIFKDLLCDYRYFTADANSRKFIKNSPYSIGEKFEFGYAITTHMAQGSEYNNGIYFEEYLNPDINHRLNYVGASRFRNFLIYVKKRPSYY